MSTTTPSQHTYYRYSTDSNGIITRVEEMYTETFQGNSYLYGTCQDYVWSRP